MRAQIRDKEAMESLRTANLRAYLEAQGWNNAGPWGHWATIYNRERNGKLWKIAVPSQEDGSDYAESMAWAVTTLAEAEDRSQLDVFHDLLNADVDMTAQANDKGAGKKTNVWCVRAEKGEYTGQFVDGEYVAAGWLPKHGLASVKDMEEIRSLFGQERLEITSIQVVGWHAGQIDAFALKINVGDYVITPGKDPVPGVVWAGNVPAVPRR